MDSDELGFHRGAVRPIECLSAGWALIKDDYWLYFGIVMIGMLIAGAVPLGVMLGPVMCGIHICLLRRERGLPVTFDMFFQGFNYFMPSFVATLFKMVPVLLMVIGFYVVYIGGFVMLLAQGQPNVDHFLIFLGVIFLLVLGMIAVGVILDALFLFTYLLIVDRELSGVESVRVCLRAVMGNLGGVVLLTLLTQLLLLIGVMMCYIGVFFVLPLIYAMEVIAYRQIFPPRDRHGALPLEEESLEQLSDEGATETVAETGIKTGTSVPSREDRVSDRPPEGDGVEEPRP
jgi:hypothetical protein